MSEVTGTVGIDVRHLYTSDQAASQTGTQKSAEKAGSWPEEMDDIRFYADSAMTLAGMGQSLDECGSYFPKQYCPTCGELHFGKLRCGKRCCPSCWNLWSQQRSEAIAIRLGAARYAATDSLDKRTIHAVASAPIGSIRSLTDVYRGFQTVYDLARQQGMRGGVALFHGYRVRKSAKRDWQTAVDDDTFDGSLWRWVRESPRDWRFLTYWSPHWHIIGLARDIKPDKPAAQNGWVFRRIRSLERFQLTSEDGYDDMVGLTRYITSHITFESNAQSEVVRWFGSLATCKFTAKSVLSAGALSTIQRYAAAAAGTDIHVCSNINESQICTEERCQGLLQPIWAAHQALADRRWCSEIGHHQYRRLQAAFRWAVGDIDPPPQQTYPQTEETARNVLKGLVH